MAVINIISVMYLFTNVFVCFLLPDSKFFCVRYNQEQKNCFCSMNGCDYETRVDSNGTNTYALVTSKNFFFFENSTTTMEY